MSLLLVNGDAVRIPLADESVHCVVTSPPYWGLRKYSGNMARVWGGVLGKSWHDHANDMQDGNSRIDYGSLATGGDTPYKVSTLGWRPTCSCCRKCDIIGTSAGGDNYATQRQGTRECMEKEMESQTLGNQCRASGESGCTEKEVSEDMQEMSSKIQRSQECEVLQSDLLGKMDVGERERKPFHVSGGREICLSENKRENNHRTSLDNGKTSREATETLGERSSHKRNTIRQPDRKSSGTDKSEPCQDPHEKQFGHSLAPYEPQKSVVFDPFAGSGTTLLVARALGRHGVGLDLSAKYLQFARERLSMDKLEGWGLYWKDEGDSLTDLPLFEEHVT